MTGQSVKKAMYNAQYFIRSLWSQDLFLAAQSYSLQVTCILIFLFFFIDNILSLFITITSSRPEYKKDVLRNFSKFTGKHLCQSLFFNKVAGLSRLKMVFSVISIFHEWKIILMYLGYRLSRYRL